MNLLTRMKSPTSSVGRIDDDGILNGSTRNERSRKTMRMTGKKLFGYSIHHGSGSPSTRRLANTSLSASVTAPVTRSRMKRISAKFVIQFGMFVVPWRDGRRALGRPDQTVI